MKLWQKNTDASDFVTAFTVGNDTAFDALIAKYDVLGSLAHIKMLESVGLLQTEDRKILSKELTAIYRQIAAGTFSIDDDVEDIHSQIEIMLTEKTGDLGKKIHSARSRNDQVLLDIKLYLRAEIESIARAVRHLFELLQSLSEKHKEELLPGYTHLQLAMPSSFGLWFGAYAEALSDDMISLKAAYDVVNKNPLGSAAGYGSSFPVNRTLTTKLLGFADLNYNVVYAQMGRGKTERNMAFAMSNIADTLGRFCADVCLYLNQHFSFISFPDEFTTGSSIMPHKKNPDVFEIMRSRCNRIKSVPNEINLITANLTSGYHRDLQLMKEILFPAITSLKECLDILPMMLQHVQVKKDLLNDEKFKYLFTVEAVNRLVMQGVSFRDAYRQVGIDVEQGAFAFNEPIVHTHEGSIGNLCNEQVAENLHRIYASFDFDVVGKALNDLLL